MPDWKMHAYACEKAAKTIKIHRLEDFVFGGILPDTPWLDSIVACTDGSQKCSLHYYVDPDTNLAPIPNYYEFLKNYKEFIRMTYVGRGMLMHLILDAVVNKNYNSVTTEVSYCEFDTVLIDGTILHTSGCEKKAKEKYKDLYAFEDTVTVDLIHKWSLSKDVLWILNRLKCPLMLCDVIDNINERLSIKHNTKNVVFSISQYESMVDDAIKIYSDICNQMLWA